MGFVSNITVMSCAHTVNVIELKFGPQTVVQKKYNSDKNYPADGAKFPIFSIE